MQYIQFQAQNASQVPTPVVGGSNLFIDLNDFNIKAKDENGQIHGGGGGITNLTYTGLVSTISTSGLSTGSFYIISDFKTCYDQPDFDIENNPITTGNTKQGVVEPIIVFATSTSTISMDAYQPLYPNDKIKYDWTFSATEVTNSVAYGRITERIDEFNNRTDYDHRTILFKRYRLYTHREGLRLNGTVELGNDGIINGVNTSFTALTVGNVIYIPNAFPNYYEIVSISGNTIMTVSGDTIGSTGVGSAFYLAVEEITNDDEYGGYFSYKRTNVKTDDFIEYTTFGDAIDESYAKNNYVGNYANNYTNISNGTFILANNVFIQGQYESNKFGDYCYNNTFGTDNQNNTWGDYCYENVSTNDIDTCIIGHYFYGNLINLNLDNNQIGNDFHSNRLLTENSTDFGNNNIGNNFNNNSIGDFGNLNNFDFYKNIIGNDFYENIIKQDFQNNQIGNQFNNNILNGDFYKNVIGNGFNNNQNIGHNFYGNHIGNAFNNNDVIGDYFQDNQIGEYFEDNNNISYNFKNNQIGNFFENNTLGNTDYFNWDNTNIENLTGRTYDTFNNSLDDNYSNIILGKELIMHFNSDSGNTLTSGSLIIGDTYEITNYIGTDDFTDVANVQSGNINENGCVFIATGEIPTVWSDGTELTELTIYDEYHKVKFTQWWQGCCNGGFSYERTKVYPSVESTVYFTRTNSGQETDVIVAGRLEITRNDSGIYNAAKEGSFDSNNSPQDTEWNSIYIENNNGSDFEDNIIGNNFKGNLIFNYFSLNNVKSYVVDNQFSGSVYTNEIGSYTISNDFLGDVGNNRWMGEFYNNNIGLNFYNNTFGVNINSNTIANDFQNNEIGSSFNDNIIGDGFGFGGSNFQGNRIGNDFSNNTISEYFYNNSIPDNFYNNTIGDYFQWNVVNTNIYDTDFTPNYGNITGFTYTTIGTGATDNLYTDIGGTTNALGINGTFNIDVSGGIVTGVTINDAGKLYVTDDTITILGTSIGGDTGVISTFSSDGIGLTGTTGSYPNVFPQGTSGENGSFDIEVVDGLVNSIILNQGGGSYLVGEILTITGDVFGSTENITITVDSVYSDDVIITVTGVSVNPSVYEQYTCQIFERQGGDKRLSFYDENDILTITNINQ